MQRWCELVGIFWQNGMHNYAAEEAGEMEFKTSGDIYGEAVDCLARPIVLRSIAYHIIQIPWQ